MNQFTILKNSKKIKVIQNKNILIINGPLGSVNFKINSWFNSNTTDLFIPHSQYNFFVEKLKKLFKSVTTGWFLELNLNGIGYKSFKLNDKIALDLGYSNLVIYKPSDILKIKNFKNKIVLFSIDEEYLNNIGNTIRNYSYPDPYKGKGMLFRNEIIKLKKKAKS